MSARVMITGLSRPRWAKFVLASLAAIGVIPLMVFTARGWWATPGFTAAPDVAVARPANPAKPPHLQATPSARSRLHSKLSLQPEADRLRRRLGKRFSAPGLEVAMLVGTLKLGAQQYTALITRSQQDDGESITVGLNGSPAVLTWNDKDGAKSAGATATGDQRALLERIALDSPDQFILAQLRAAVYQTIAQQARPAEAGGSDNYKGPVWDLIRIGEIELPGRSKPQSPWRLYHINATTGLIEKVVSEEQGQTITAEITGWVNQGGETVPTRITWMRGNQKAMELSITNATYGPKR